MLRSFLSCLITVVFLNGCAQVETSDELAHAQTMITPPEGAPEGSCWARDATPAVIETVTEHVIAEVERRDAEGNLIQPAAYRTETRQEIVQERVEMVFEMVCPDAMTPELIATLQRALEVRGYYAGAITGVMDRSTHRALRVFQRQEGPDSAILSVQGARRLGLVAVPREEV